MGIAVPLQQSQFDDAMHSCQTPNKLTRCLGTVKLTLAEMFGTDEDGLRKANTQRHTQKKPEDRCCFWSLSLQSRIVDVKIVSSCSSLTALSTYTMICLWNFECLCLLRRIRGCWGGWACFPVYSIKINLPVDAGIHSVPAGCVDLQVAWLTDPYEIHRMQDCQRIATCP